MGGGDTLAGCDAYSSIIALGNRYLILSPVALGRTLEQGRGGSLFLNRPARGKGGGEVTFQHWVSLFKSWAPSGGQAGAGGQPDEERGRHLDQEATRAGHIPSLGTLIVLVQVIVILFF